MTNDPFPRNTINRPADLSATIDWAANELPGDLAGKAGTEATFVFGHSFGAFSTFAGGGVDVDYDAPLASCTSDCDAYAEPGVEDALRAGFGDPRVVAIAPQAPPSCPHTPKASYAISRCPRC